MTTPVTPYRAAHVDEHKTLIPKFVKRPEVMSTYFQYKGPGIGKEVGYPRWVFLSLAFSPQR